VPQQKVFAIYANVCPENSTEKAKLCQVQSVVLQNLQIFGAPAVGGTKSFTKEIPTKCRIKVSSRAKGQVPDGAWWWLIFFALWLDALCTL
jgi:hypothetical protein